MTMSKEGVVVLFGVYIVLVGWTGYRTAPNKTELGHMGATAYFLNTLRFDVFCVNPPLTRIFSALPVALCQPKYDVGHYSPRPQDRAEWEMGVAFVRANSRHTVLRSFIAARWSLIPLLVLGAYCGYRLSRDIYGKSSGLLFLVLWMFSPPLLAWGATICPDAVSAALGVVAIYCFRQWLREPNWKHAGVAGICLGLLPLAKLTWIVAFGLWPAIWCCWAPPVYLTKADKRSLPLPRVRQLAAILVLGLYTLNMGYLFDGTCRPLGKYRFISRLFRGRGDPESEQRPIMENRFAGTWLGAVPIPLPADFVQGIDTQRYDFERGMPSYLRGEWGARGWWYYYVYALAIKEPIGNWCLLALAIAVTLFGSGYSASWRDEMLVLVPICAILILVSSQTGFSAHYRYVICVLPLVCIWISRVARVFEVRPLTRKRLTMAVMIVLAIAWSGASCLAVYPHCLSYFNELAAVVPTPNDASYLGHVLECSKNFGFLSTIRDALSAGTRNGPRHLLGSNMDWGQDLFCLENWQEAHSGAWPIRVAYFGSYPLSQSGIKLAGPPPVGPNWEQISDRTDTSALGPLPGWYALSINEVFDQSQRYRYFLRFRPVATAGYSIFIYQITLAEANLVRRQLGLPELAER